MNDPAPPEPGRKTGYPTREEMSRLLKLGLLTALSGNLVACVQQAAIPPGAPLPPPARTGGQVMPTWEAGQFPRKTFLKERSANEED